MAPKVVVPADFGVENLHCEFHGNVVLKLQGGEDMRANSLILSYHSSLFVRLFLELHQSVVEMDDFSKASVKSFLEALYSGEIQLDRELFRDVNKMCHVFEVDWLSRRCGDYFAGLVGDVSTSTDYQTLFFLFEEARFCSKTLKSNVLLDLVVQKMCGLENRAEIFVQPYMKNYTQLETSQLDIMLQITRENPVSLLTIVKQNIENGALFHDNDAYLVENIDLCKCLSNDEALLEETFEVILDSSDLSRKNERFVNKLYRKVYKDFKTWNSNFEIEHSVSEDSLTSKENEIDSLFVSFQSFSNLGLQAFYDQSMVSPLMSNLYMFIEGLWHNINRLPPHPAMGFDWSTMILNINRLLSERNWKRISPKYLYDQSKDYKLVLQTLVRRAPHIISKTDDTYRLFGKVIDIVGSTEKKLRFSDLFARRVKFAYYLPQSATTKLCCSRSGSCGFILETEPVLKDGNPHKFKASISHDVSKYPDDLHPHPEVINVKETHLMLSAYLRNETKMKLWPFCLVWNGNGVRVQGNSSGEKWYLDPYILYAKEPVGIVVFM